jgi:hypothetical protein
MNKKITRLRIAEWTPDDVDRFASFVAPRYKKIETVTTGSENNLEGVGKMIEALRNYIQIGCGRWQLVHMGKDGGYYWALLERIVLTPDEADACVEVIKWEK